MGSVRRRQRKEGERVRLADRAHLLAPALKRGEGELDFILEYCNLKVSGGVWLFILKKKLTVNLL